MIVPYKRSVFWNEKWKRKDEISLNVALICMYTICQWGLVWRSLISHYIPRIADAAARLQYPGRAFPVRLDRRNSAPTHARAWRMGIKADLLLCEDTSEKRSQLHKLTSIQASRKMISNIGSTMILLSLSLAALISSCIAIPTMMDTKTSIGTAHTSIHSPAKLCIYASFLLQT